MRAIILAAGVGSRMKNMYVSNKSLLEVRGKSILRNTVDILENMDIETCVIIGYNYDKIMGELKECHVNYIYNPFFRKMNSLGSLWFARDYFDQDVMVLNADTYFDESVFELINNENGELIICVDSSNISKSGFYLYFDENNRIIKYCDTLELNDYRVYEYGNMMKMNDVGANRYKMLMEQYIASEQYDTWWEYIVYQNSEKFDIEVCDIKGKKWGEVDTEEDYFSLCNLYACSRKDDNI